MYVAVFISKRGIEWIHRQCAVPHRSAGAIHSHKAVFITLLHIPGFRVYARNDVGVNVGESVDVNVTGNVGVKVRESVGGQAEEGTNIQATIIHDTATSIPTFTSTNTPTDVGVNVAVNVRVNVGESVVINMGKGQNMPVVIIHDTDTPSLTPQARPS